MTVDANLSLIRELREDGKSFEYIGRELGIGATTVSRLIDKHMPDLVAHKKKNFSSEQSRRVYLIRKSYNALSEHDQKVIDEIEADLKFYPLYDTTRTERLELVMSIGAFLNIMDKKK